MAKSWIRLLVLALVAAAAIALWQGYRAKREREAREAADLQAGLRSSEVLSAAFSQAAQLRVATLSGAVLSQGECRSGYFVPNQQRTVAPYSASYFVDLGDVGRASYRWNAADRVMFVDLPEVAVDQPNIDLSRARSAQSGVFVSRACGLAMQQQVAGRMAARAGEKARDPKYLAQARESARRVVTDLVRAPLAAAGLGDVTVRVRFPADKRPANDDQWDLSRSIEDVLADPKYR